MIAKSSAALVLGVLGTVGAGCSPILHLLRAKVANMLHPWVDPKDTAALHTVA
jgi:hypothetical protein